MNSFLSLYNKLSLEINKKKNINNKVIIQKQITKVSMSGVIFTHELINGSPYYVINYDDNSKKTDTVTSGYGENSNKKLIIYIYLQIIYKLFYVN